MFAVVIILGLLFLAVEAASFFLPNDARWVPRLCGLIPLVICVMVMILAGVRIMDATEVGVVKTFGEISRTIDSGLNFINPLFDEVTVYDTKVQVAESSFSSYTKDAQPVSASIEYQYSINPDPESVSDIALRYGSAKNLEAKIGNIVEEKVKTVFARYSAMTLLENRAQLSAEVNAAMDSVEQLFRISFSSIVVRDIDFSDAFEKSVEAKMEAEQNALKAEQEKKKAVIQAEQAKEVAEINAQAAIAEAKGEAEAMMIRKEALDKMPATYIEQMWIEKWNGELPKFVTEGNGLMLSPNM